MSHPEPGAEPPPSRREPLHWTQIVNGAALLLLAALAIAGVVFSLDFSWWFAPAALVLVPVAGLAAWGALVQLSGGAHMDDHPWV